MFVAALSNPAVVAECGGIGAILRNVLDCYNFPRVNESLLATVLYLLNHPSTRQYVRPDVDLEVGIHINCENDEKILPKPSPGFITT